MHAPKPTSTGAKKSDIVNFESVEPTGELFIFSADNGPKLAVPSLASKVADSAVENKIAATVTFSAPTDRRRGKNNRNKQTVSGDKDKKKK